VCIQTKESIIIKGQKYSLFTCPLAGYWTKKNPKPAIKLPVSSCRRGYVATWEIFHECLYLVRIIFHAPEDDFGLDFIFPGNTGKVKASWYTGELKIPIGNELCQVHMIDSVYDADWFIYIKKGKVIGNRYKANY
jgi:hypothetical protein